jgi:hypothetical protein
LSRTLRDGTRIVRRHFVESALRRRVVALATAYVVALSSLLSSFGAARAAAEAVAHPVGIFCHGAAPEGTTFPADRGNNGLCIDCCCAGCLTPLTALPPPANDLPPLRAVGYRVALPATAALAPARTAKAHRCRAPPSDA